MATVRKLILAPLSPTAIGEAVTQRALGSLVKCADGTTKLVEDVAVDDVICVEDALGFQRVVSNEEEVI